MTGIPGFVVADRGLLARGAGPKTPVAHYKPGRAAISIIEYGGSDSASGVEECGQATVSKGIRRNPAIRAGSGGYWGSLAGVGEGRWKTRVAEAPKRQGQAMVEDRGRRALDRCGGRSGSTLGSGSGVRVELGGDQTSPVFVQLGVAKLGFEVQAEEGMKDVVGQERHQQECLDGLGLVFVNVVGFPTMDQFIEAEVLDVPSLIFREAASCREPVGRAWNGSSARQARGWCGSWVSPNRTHS